MTRSSLKRHSGSRKERRSRERALRESIPKKKKRQRDNSYVGSGPLHREIAAAAEAEGVKIVDLLVLSESVDFYNFDTVANHAEARRFKAQVDRFAAGALRVHLRGLFYKVIGNTRRPRVDGGPDDGDEPVIENSEANWFWFQNTSLRARWLDYVPFERIRDKRNEDARFHAYADAPSSGTISVKAGSDIDLPDMADFLPSLISNLPRNQQPFRLAFIMEKSSVADVLEPIANEVKADLVPMTGKASHTRIYEMAERASKDSRELIVLYFSDFDPSGWDMPLDVGHYLRGFRTKEFPNLRWRLVRVALTLEQVKYYKLPSTPLKDTEKRGTKWKRRMGWEQTEIDALLALREGELERLTYEALEPFFDFTLEQRCADAMRQRKAEAEAKLEQNPEWPSIRESIKEAYTAAVDAIDELQRVKNNAVAWLQAEDEHRISSIRIAAPEVIITAQPKEVLADSSDDFVTASRKLQDAKNYVPRGGDPSYKVTDEGDDDDVTDDDDDDDDITDEDDDE